LQRAPVFNIGGQASLQEAQMMHCHTCGAEVTEGLKFCTRCGANLILPKTAETKIDYGKMAGMFWAVAVFGFIALSVVIGSAIPLTVLQAPQDVIFAALFFGSTAVVLIAGLLIRQLSRLISLAKGDDERRPPRAIDTNQLSRPQISAPPRAMGSVTEHTTRNFDAVYRDSEAQK
jgi:hypothetical protein